MSNEIKASCKNCKYQSSWYWAILKMFNASYWNMSNQGVFCVKREFYIGGKYGYRPKDLFGCPNYKRKWWKFWV